MKKMLFVALLTGVAFALYAQNAESIVRESREKNAADTTLSKSRMVITKKDGSNTERVIEQYSKDGPKGKRAMIVFQQPASVAGTRFLTMENPGSADDRWIYLPGVGKVRRIAASEGSSSFVGTDFSYDDISSASRNVDSDTHTLLREEALEGVSCYVIQSEPKDKSFQYSKMISWITKDSKITVKIELYNKRGVMVKVATMSGIKEIQGRLTATVTKMETLAAGTSTTIYMDIKYGDPIPESVFTTDFLETGRVR